MISYLEIFERVIHSKTYSLCSGSEHKHMVMNLCIIDCSYQPNFIFLFSSFHALSISYLDKSTLPSTILPVKSITSYPTVSINLLKNLINLTFFLYLSHVLYMHWFSPNSNTCPVCNHFPLG